MLPGEGGSRVFEDECQSLIDSLQKLKKFDQARDLAQAAGLSTDRVVIQQVTSCVLYSKVPSFPQYRKKKKIDGIWEENRKTQNFTENIIFLYWTFRNTENTVKNT